MLVMCRSLCWCRCRLVDDPLRRTGAFLCRCKSVEKFPVVLSCIALISRCTLDVTPDFHTNTQSARWSAALLSRAATLQRPSLVVLGHQTSRVCPRVCLYVCVCVVVSLRVLVLCLSTHTVALSFVQAILSYPRPDTTIVGRTDRDVDVPVVVAVLLHAVAVVVKYY